MAGRGAGYVWKAGLVFCLVFRALAGATEGWEGLKGRRVAVRTEGKGVFRGELLTVAEDRLELVSPDGSIVSVSRRAVTEVVPVEEKGVGRDFQDSAANRFVVMPTAFPMEKGEFHIASHQLAFFNAAYGVSSAVSVWAGVTVLGGLLNGRVSLRPAERLGFSAGIFAGGTWFSPFTALLLPYGVMSVGAENRNMSVGLGWPLGYFRQTVETPEGIESGPWVFRTLGAVAVLAGKVPLSSTTAFVSENWFAVPYDGRTWDTGLAVIPMQVLRVAGPRWSWDVGLALPVRVSSDEGLRWLFGGTALIPVPVLSVTYRID